MMIPFNHLGYIFKRFGKWVYPYAVKEELCLSLKDVISKSKVLDVGSGTGMMSEFAYLCREDLELHAIDPAEGMLKYSEAYIETYKGVAEELPFDDSSFEVLLMGESLHHFRDINKSLEECARILGDKGKLFIYDFNLDTFMGKTICRAEKLLGEPGNFFEPETLKKILEKYGFTVTIKKYSWRYTILAILEK